MDQLTSGVRVCHSPSSISGAICRPPVRPQTYRARRLTTTATRGTLVPPTPHRTRRFYRGTPQIDRSVRDRRRFNVYTYIYIISAPPTHPRTLARQLFRNPPPLLFSKHALSARVQRITAPHCLVNRSARFFFLFLCFSTYIYKRPPDIILLSTQSRTLDSSRRRTTNAETKNYYKIENHTVYVRFL